MSQNSYNADLAPSFAGMKADSRFDLVESLMAVGTINFGRGLAIEAGNTTQVTIPKNDNAKLVFDADFVLDNKINGKVNGEAWTEVDWDTDHDTTAAALVSAIGALSGVTCELDSADVNNRTFLIETDGVAITLSDVAVTGGASQAGSTVTYSADDVFRGIALHENNENGYYSDTEPVSVLRQGAVWVDTGVAVTADDDAYIDLSGNIGKFTNVSTNNLATGGKFRSTTAGAGLAIVEINLP